MSEIKSNITLLHPTDDYEIKTETQSDKIINTVTYSDGTIVVQTIENGFMHVHVLNRDVEYSEDGKTAWIKK